MMLRNVVFYGTLAVFPGICCESCYSCQDDAEITLCVSKSGQVTFRTEVK